jgi:hypothetical protein
VYVEALSWVDSTSKKFFRISNNRFSTKGTFNLAEEDALRKK